VSTAASKHLRRYTDLSALVYLLREQKITLLDPSSWDDTNDSRFLALYRERKKLKSVLALCFTQSRETYHHWRIFAGGCGGVCIQFNRQKLMKATDGYADLRSGDVHYLTLSQCGRKQLKIEELPFLKRRAFQPEDEFRLIYESKIKKLPSFNVDIPLTSIELIILSPWIHPDLAKHVREVLRSIRNCRGLKIRRSRLISNDQWKSFGESAN
jgi:hypothetical protein